MQSTPDAPHCPVCGKPELVQKATDGRGRFLACRECRTETYLPAPSPDDLKLAYQGFNAGQIAREDFEAYVNHARNIISRDVAVAGQRAPAGLALLDYGCGGGHFVKAARELGMDAVGIDLDEEDARFGASHGLTIEIGDHRALDELFGDRTFDVVYMMHVLEHVPDPAAVLRDLTRRLSAGGILVIRVPDQSSVPSRIKQSLRGFGIKRREWGFVQPPIHLHGYAKESLRHLAGANGLEIVRLARVSPLDPSEFPSTERYWRNLGPQRTVYALGRTLGSGGHLAAIMRRPARS